MEELHGHINSFFIESKCGRRKFEGHTNQQFPQRQANSNGFICTAIKYGGSTVLEYTYIIPNPLFLVLCNALRYPSDIADLLYAG